MMGFLSSPAAQLALISPDNLIQFFLEIKQARPFHISQIWVFIYLRQSCMRVLYWMPDTEQLSFKFLQTKLFVTSKSNDPSTISMSWTSAHRTMAPREDVNEFCTIPKIYNSYIWMLMYEVYLQDESMSHPYTRLPIYKWYIDVIMTYCQIWSDLYSYYSDRSPECRDASYQWSENRHHYGTCSQWIRAFLPICLLHQHRCCKYAQLNLYDLYSKK